MSNYYKTALILIIILSVGGFAFSNISITDKQALGFESIAFEGGYKLNISDYGLNLFGVHKINDDYYVKNYEELREIVKLNNGTPASIKIRAGDYYLNSSGTYIPFYMSSNHKVICDEGVTFWGQDGLIMFYTNDVEFQNFSLINCNLEGQGQNYISGTNFGVYMRNSNTSNILFKDNNFLNFANNHALGFGFKRTNTNILISNNKFENVAGGMSIWFANNTRVLNNVLIARNASLGEGEGIELNTEAATPNRETYKSNLVSGNLIYYFIENAIDINTYDSIVSNNIIYNPTQSHLRYLQQTTSIDTAGAKNILIEGNVIYNCGIYDYCIDTQGENVSIINNVINGDNSGGTAIRIEGSENYVMNNNINGEFTNDIINMGSGNEIQTLKNYKPYKIQNQVIAFVEMDDINLYDLSEFKNNGTTAGTVTFDENLGADFRAGGKLVLANAEQYKTAYNDFTVALVISNFTRTGTQSIIDLKDASTSRGVSIEHSSSGYFKIGVRGDGDTGTKSYNTEIVEFGFSNKPSMLVIDIRPSENMSYWYLDGYLADTEAIQPKGSLSISSDNLEVSEIVGGINGFASDFIIFNGSLSQTDIHNLWQLYKQDKINDYVNSPCKYIKGETEYLWVC